MIRLLIADDQELFRTALAALLGLQEDFEVVASVGRGDEVAAAAREHQPDVALLDIEMPGIDGLAAAAVLAREAPRCRSLILTTFGRPGYLRRSMESGAVGFVVKDAPAEQLADAIRRVVAGERVVDPALAAATLAGGVSPLTARERDVLVAARPGATVADIAEQLVPVRGHGAQLPVGRDGQGRGAQPRRGGPDSRRARLALTREPTSHALQCSPAAAACLTAWVTRPRAAVPRRHCCQKSVTSIPPSGSRPTKSSAGEAWRSETMPQPRPSRTAWVNSAEPGV